MTTNAEDKRSLIISNETEEELCLALERIPGYSVEPLQDDLRRSMVLPAGEQRLCLRSSAGERILVRHRTGEATAETVNILDQDAMDAAVPIHADEVVKLHRAIQSVDGLHSRVIAAEIDLIPPGD